MSTEPACHNAYLHEAVRRKQVLWRVGTGVFRPWMNAERVPLEAPKERSRVCFGGFRPTKHVEEPWAFARGVHKSFANQFLPPS